MDVRGSREGAHRLLRALASFPRERLAFSQADVEARVVVAQMMQQAGLEVSIDHAFNVVGRLEGLEPLPPLVVGSHVDTVPNPGRLDGALGVVGGIECARHLRDAGVKLRHPLVVVAFSDEEGTLTWGCWGSRAVRGRLTTEEKEALSDPVSSLSQAMLAAAAHLATLGWSIDPLAASGCDLLEPSAYVELHVEQGPVLERARVSTAAVTSIVGIDRYEISFSGASGHAGTVPMADRDDAVVRAADLVRQFWSYVLDLGDQAVANIGQIKVDPGSFNVIPGKVELWVEARSYDPEVMDKMKARLTELVTSRGGAARLIGHEEPLALSHDIRRLILESARSAQLACLELPSWAGHDAGVFALDVPTGMIFVPSVRGVSHSPEERTDADDIADGLRLLVTSLQTLDQQLDHGGLTAK